MNDIIYKYLCTYIPYCFVSVYNDYFLSSYNFNIPEENGESTSVSISSLYSHYGPKGTYVAYELYIDDVLVERAVKPVLNKNKGIKTKADKLEHIMKLCSNKIIAQEYASHKTHMLKNLVNPRNPYES